MTSILLHACCGPCATYVVRRLREQGHDVTAFWYNPNIHPFREHQRRLESMQTLAESENLPLIIAEGYDMLEYFRAVVGHEGERCPDCYRLRLARTAEVANQKGIDAFTTTLLISPYQKQDLILEIGEELGGKWGVEFHFEDFSPGFRESQRLSRELGLYHQGYCGCVYSEWERYGKVKM
ncbi:MAG TPA: epoxyqueuosine reductase QueH [Dehalococcoidia bacterium]|nr:epoxyqueuosine reductase QueH [Dehalococcoidia bacterium]